MKRLIDYKYSILIPICLLLCISIFTMYKSTILGTKELIISLVSIVSILLVQKINIKWLIEHSFIFYLINILLLVLVLIIGKETNGSKAWLDLYYLKIQPSEIMKITLLLYLIKLNISNKNILLLLLATIIPSILTYLEPDTGSLIIYFIILFSTILYNKKYKKALLFLIPIFSILISACIFLYINNKDVFINIFGTSIFYRIDRILNFKTNLQIKNALISIGAHSYTYFPEYHNDFIFAYILSELPITITVIIILAYLYIFDYLLKNKNPINTSTLLLTLFLVFYNIFMNLGLIPIIGIPLPFLSYGGSYLISISILIGLVINIYNKDNNYMVHNN